MSVKEWESCKIILLMPKKRARERKNKSFDSGSSIDSLRLRCGQRGKALVCLSINECQSVHCKQWGWEIGKVSRRWTWCVPDGRRNRNVGSNDDRPVCKEKKDTQAMKRKRSARWGHGSEEDWERAGVPCRCWLCCQSCGCRWRWLVVAGFRPVKRK